MYAVLAPTAAIQPCTALATNSGPLSELYRAAVLCRAVPGSPAPTGALVDPEFRTGQGATRAGRLGLLDQRDGVPAIWGADHASSPSPQIAAAFFRSTSSAAASASSAFSLRARSCSRALTQLQHLDFA